MKWIVTGLFLFVLGLNATQYYRTYIYVSTPMDWNAAYTYCTTYYTNLATITTQETQQRLLESAEVTFSGAWIGLYKPSGNPNTLAWANEELYAFTMLQSNNQHYSCAYTTELEWYLDNCPNNHPFFCHIDYYLWLVKSNMAWEDALDYCRYWYNDLFSTTDQYQFEAFQNISKASMTEGVWTGLRFMAGEWHWVSGVFTYIPFKAILPSCPKEPYRCGAYNISSVEWDMRDCEENLNFICYQLK